LSDIEFFIGFSTGGRYCERHAVRCSVLSRIPWGFLALPSQKEAAIRPGGRQISLRNEFFRLAERSVRVRRGPAQGSRLPAGSCVRPGRVKARSSEPASEAVTILAKRWLSLSIKSQAAPPFFPLGSEPIDPAQFRPFGDELGSRAAKVGLAPRAGRERPPALQGAPSTAGPAVCSAT
jgi:hypothetical protein